MYKSNKKLVLKADGGLSSLIPKPKLNYIPSSYFFSQPSSGSNWQQYYTNSLTLPESNSGRVNLQPGEKLFPYSGDMSEYKFAGDGPYKSDLTLGNPFLADRSYLDLPRRGLSRKPAVDELPRRDKVWTAPGLELSGDQPTNPSLLDNAKRLAGNTGRLIAKGAGDAGRFIGENTPNIPIGFGDIAQGILAYKAFKNPVASVKPMKVKAMKGPVNEVLAPRKLNTWAENEAISKVRTPKLTSDPVLAGILNTMTEANLQKAKGELAARENLFNVNELKAYNEAVNEQKAQIAQNEAYRTDAENLNEQARYQADIAEAQAEQNRFSQLYQNLGTVFANLQDRVWKNKLVSKQYQAESQLMDQQLAYDNYLKAKNNYVYAQKYEPEKIQQALEELNSAKENYTKLKSNFKV